ncbi:MAG: ABC transporter ATP-binding protein [Thermoplasmata archaeon]|nr:ABC transporter ATP-binding protein [Thermoplasmata archaeon]MBE3136811.1 ABC transporter ATP-binding protein [Thermoplasmata archaeon]MBE3140647.1 ABC transporter ATP-binding protein [Thermoplasmata archaeon]
MSEYVIDIDSLTKIYQTGKTDFKALNTVTLKIRKGDFVAIMGPSGSGKSTLMNIIGCLDRPTSGTVIIDGENISIVSDNELAEIRGRKIGFIFQKFNLIPTMTALKNIALPMVFLGGTTADRDRRAAELLGKVGLTNWATHRPSELSGGQQQRIAIARALSNNPSIILADEPTGNLDTKTGEQIMGLLVALNKEGKTILLVTHAIALKRFANRVINMLDGEVSEKS